MKIKELEILCKKVLDQYPDKVNNYRLGKVGFIGMFAGEVMIESKGQADPKTIIVVLKELLNDNRNTNI